LKIVQTWSNAALPPFPFIDLAGQVFGVTSAGLIVPLPSGPSIKLHGAVSASPVVRRGKALIFLQDCSIVEFDPALRTLSRLRVMPAPVIEAVAEPSGRLLLATREGILYSLPADGTNLAVLGFTGCPVPGGLTATGSGIEIVNTDGITSVLAPDPAENAPGAFRLTVTERTSRRTAPFAVVSNILFTLEDGRLFSDAHRGGLVAEISALPEPCDYRLTALPPWLFLHAVSGPSFFMRVQSNTSGPALVLERPAVRSFTNGRKEWYRCTYSNRVLRVGSASGCDEIRDAGVEIDRIVDVRASDLDGDRVPDLVIASLDNITLAYYRLLVVLRRGDAAPLVQRFTTIDYRSFQETFPDLDGDGRREMLLNKEMLINFSKKLGERLLVPDVYSLSRAGYRWDSISFPGFFASEIPRAEAAALREPFYDRGQNTLWRDLNREVIRLETQLVTLNRQMKDLKARERDERNRQGLSVWFYKKGVEFYMNRWDNLALFAFRKSLELDERNSLALFQVTRIYCDHGLYSRALAARRRPAPQEIPYLESQDYYTMTEERLPVMVEPGPLYTAMNLAAIFYENGLYAEAARRYEEVLKMASPPPDADLAARALKRLSDCRLVMNEFKPALKALMSVKGYRNDPELAYREKMINRMISGTAAR
jgi:tetratricopeptide (TPR) repeat protein